MNNSTQAHTVARGGRAIHANAHVPNTSSANPATPSTNIQSLPKWLIRDGRGGWRRIVQNFLPSWFSVTMGTGIVSILLHTFSTMYAGHSNALEILSIIFFILNVVLFSLILFVSTLRYILYPATWCMLLHHPVQSLFLGTVPMGFSTLTNMFVLVCVPRWGGASAQVAWAMWWANVVISVTCCIGLPFQMMTNHKNRHDTMTAAWLLPIVAPIVSSASGAVVASVLPNPRHALWTIITSYILWGAGMPLAMVVLVIYFHRLAVYKLPPQEVIVSVFLPLGPMGQGGYAIIQLGKMAMEIFPLTKTIHPMAGEILYVLGFGVAIILWGFGVVWFFFALASIMTRQRFPFNMGWWGFTFPIGVFTTSTLAIGEELPSALFKIMGTAIGVSVMLLWFVVAFGTVKGMVRGNLFEAPCLREMERAARAMVEKEQQDA